MLQRSVPQHEVLTPLTEFPEFRVGHTVASLHILSTVASPFIVTTLVFFK